MELPLYLIKKIAPTKNPMLRILRTKSARQHERERDSRHGYEKQQCWATTTANSGDRSATGSDRKRRLRIRTRKRNSLTA
jgi:hypothetical protein